MAIDKSDVLAEVIKGRRSIRSYKDTKVPRELLVKILEAGQWAPSPSNVQSWRFIVVQEAALSALKDLSPGFPKKATVAIVVCSNTREMQPFDEVTAAEEAVMAVENMSLMAYSLGLGTCPVVSFSRAGIKTLLEIPDHIRPIILIALGFPDETPVPPARKPLSQIVSWEKYNGQ
jgi:nitroreductase